MIMVDTNERLAELLEKLSNGTATEFDKSDAIDLADDLKRDSSHMVLIERHKVNSLTNEVEKAREEELKFR